MRLPVTAILALVLTKSNAALADDHWWGAHAQVLITSEGFQPLPTIGSDGRVSIGALVRHDNRGTLVLTVDPDRGIVVGSRRAEPRTNLWECD